MLIESRWYQDEAEYATLDYLYKTPPGSNPVIALPTGTGKGVVIAKLVRNLLHRWPNQRVAMFTHVKELIEQNKNKLIEVWPHAPVGVYSAGLKSRDVSTPIVFGGVQSVAKNVRAFGWRSVVVIDEAHLVSPKENTMYQAVIRGLTEINPFLRVVGLSATPWRTKQGLITDEGIFTDICYDLTGLESFNRLIAEGYLCPLIPKPTSVEIDVSNIGLNSAGDDYNTAQQENEAEKILNAAVREIIEYGQNRRSWLVFTAGIKSAEQTAALLQSYGIAAAAIHSKLSDKVNDERITAFKRGELRCLVGNNKFTTGFDHPPVDLIAMLRCTLSPGLWVQMLGRGTRPCPRTGKINCLVLDFAGNTRRLGPINDPRIPNKAGKGTGDAPVKICPNCGIYNHASSRYCGRVPYRSAEGCGFEFQFEIKYEGTADTEQLLRSDMPQVERFAVSHVFYSPITSHKTEKPMLKVHYACGLRSFSELVLLEHNGYPKRRAHEWWKQRAGFDAPETVEQALQVTTRLKTPTHIRVWVNKERPEVLSHEF